MPLGNQRVAKSSVRPVTGLTQAWLPLPEERTAVMSGTIYALVYLVNNTNTLI
jgi:hypothetical protein